MKNEETLGIVLLEGEEFTCDTYEELTNGKGDEINE